MNTIRYYRTINSAVWDENNCNDLSDSFIVNCTGYENRTDKFECYKPNGRKDNYFIYMQDGEMAIITEDNNENIISKGQCIFFEAGRHVHYKSKTSPVMYYWIHFTGHSISKEMERFKFSHEHIIDVGVNNSIIYFFHKMFDEFTMRYSDFSYNSAMCMLQIFVQIKRLTSTFIKEPSIRFKESLLYINDHYNSDISIVELAKIEGMCISRFRDLFTKQMGVSPKQYITHLRISNSCDLLEFTDLSIDEISSKCGYGDIRYFYRVFKNANGITPFQFRNLHNIR